MLNAAHKAALDPAVFKLCPAKDDLTSFVSYVEMFQEVRRLHRAHTNAPLG